MEVTISVSAAEKVCPRQYQSSERSVFISCKLEIPDGSDPASHPEVVRNCQTMQLRAEAQMYASLHRDFVSQGVPQNWLRDAAVNRAGRIGQNESIKDMCG